MGNSCFVKSDGSTCATALGSCENKKCSSSCTKSVQQEVVQLEEVVDLVLKKWIDDHLHKYLQNHLPSPIATQIEETLVEAINIDLVPRLSVVKETASETDQPKSPSNV